MTPSNTRRNFNMEFTAKQVARLLIDNYKGKVALPANFSETGKTVEGVITDAFFSVMGLSKEGCTVEDIQLAFRKEEVRNGVFAIVEEVIREGILTESWRNAFMDQFVESRSQRRGDSTEFYIESKQELHVSRVSKDGKVRIDRQRFDEGESITVKVETFAIKVYEHLARIMLGRADWGSLVAHLNASVEKFIQTRVYLAFAEVVKAIPAAFKVSSASPKAADVLKAVRNVKAVSGANQVMLVGTALALDVLQGIEEHSDNMKDEIHNNGILRTFKGIPLVELPAILGEGNEDFTSADLKMVNPDNIIYILPNNIGKPVKMIVEPALIDVNESGVRADDTIEFAVRFSFGLELITGSVLGALSLA